MADRLYKGPFNEDMRLVDMGDGTFAERTEAHPPLKLMTDDNGDYARLRVDVGQTGFFAGREFRTLLEFDIGNNEEIVIKVTSACDVILTMFGALLVQSDLRVELIEGGTEGGTFNNALPILKTNNMSTASDYASQVTMAYGGTHTGGTVVDVLLLNAGVDQGNRRAVDTSAAEEYPIGFPAGTYYLKLENTNSADALGIFRARWEERP